MKICQATGIVTGSNGGLFTVYLTEDENGNEKSEIGARARGNLRKKGSLLVGDKVRVTYQAEKAPSGDGGDAMVEEILPRTSALIRPPMANLGVLFVTLAVAEPNPDLLTTDKLLCIAEHHSIEAKIVITKTDKSLENAKKLANIYRKAGYTVFEVDNKTGDGVDAVKNWINGNLNGRISAFSGASGVGKSTLLNRLFPDLNLETGDLSERISRGKNTTRLTKLYPVENGFLADTAGFTMLDFEHFDFFTLADLPETFPEFVPYIGKCRYRNCTHTKEEDCAIVQAVKSDTLPPSRHNTYKILYETLKKKETKN